MIYKENATIYKENSLWRLEIQSKDYNLIRNFAECEEIFFFPFLNCLSWIKRYEVIQKGIYSDAFDFILSTFIILNDKGDSESKERKYLNTNLNCD